ncbi:putative mitochondrial protein [Cucumis melo var. makuwa]|uniref:Putative mitochondrial protein n=1 Tax=Cucumis melo var. makuwa TaxID=1194695 RepID=A0A5D3DR72_CUCMM|nr:putative mitochondrial protein [Cucumis melo var. makuwa]
MIESLLYLTSSRPNIAYVVSICTRFQSDPRVSHIGFNLILVFHILLQLKELSNMFMAQVSLKYYTLMIQIELLLATVIWIGQDAQMIGNTLHEDVSFSATISSPSLVKSKKLCFIIYSRGRIYCSRNLSVSLHDENVAGITLDNIESEPVVSESHMSALDLDESDDVSLFRLLKKGQRGKRVVVKFRGRSS